MLFFELKQPLRRDQKWAFVLMAVSLPYSIWNPLGTLSAVLFGVGAAAVSYVLIRDRGQSSGVRLAAMCLGLGLVVGAGALGLDRYVHHWRTIDPDVARFLFEAYAAEAPGDAALQAAIAAALADGTVRADEMARVEALVQGPDQ